MSAGRPILRTVLIAAGLAATAGIAWALWPSGQYQPVRANQNGTLIGFGHLLSSPARVAHPSAVPQTVRLAPGTHLAVAAIPVGGPTKAHPALYVIPSQNGDPAVALLDPGDSGSGDVVDATAFPFTLPNGSTSSTPATGTVTRGGVTYRIAYSLVKVENGAPVTPRNSASAIVTCNACTTVAVSFQLVLIVGQSNVIAPINSAVAVNKDCPACLTTAIADQIVVTLKSEPSDELVAKLEAALKQLDALPALGADGTPAAVAKVVAAVQQQIETTLRDSGLLANQTTTATTTTATTSTSTATSPTPTTTAQTATTTQPATTTAATTTSASSTTQATTTTAPATTATSTTTTTP